MGTAVNRKEVALVVPCLAKDKPTKLLGQSKQQGHSWSTKAPESTPASPMLTPLHPASGTTATLTATGNPPQASTQGHETGITHGPRELPCTWAGKAEGGETSLRQGKQGSLINEQQPHELPARCQASLPYLPRTNKP